MTFILALLKPFALKIALWSGIAVAVLAILAGVRNSGRQAERVTNLKKALEAENERKQVDVDVAGAADNVERERLRERWTRD